MEGGVAPKVSEKTTQANTHISYSTTICVIVGIKLKTEDITLPYLEQHLVLIKRIASRVHIYILMQDNAVIY